MESHRNSNNVKSVYDELANAFYQTEFRVAYSNPNAKRLKGFEHYEQNRLGRMAYKPEKDLKGVDGILPLSVGQPYKQVIPRYTLPKDL